MRTINKKFIPPADCRVPTSSELARERERERESMQQDQTTSSLPSSSECSSSSAPQTEEAREGTHALPVISLIIF